METSILPFRDSPFSISSSTPTITIPRSTGDPGHPQPQNSSAGGNGRRVRSSWANGPQAPNSWASGCPARSFWVNERRARNSWASGCPDRSFWVNGRLAPNSWARGCRVRNSSGNGHRVRSFWVNGHTVVATTAFMEASATSTVSTDLCINGSPKWPRPDYKAIENST